MLNFVVVNVRIKCDNLKTKHNSVVGEREKALNKALEEMKVVRQAYHGNVMVGNHCIVVLKTFQALTTVINDNVIFKLFSDIMQYVSVAS